MARRVEVLGRASIVLLAIGLRTLASCSDTSSSDPNGTGGMTQGGASSGGRGGDGPLAAGQTSMGGTAGAGSGGVPSASEAGRGGATESGQAGQMVWGGAGGAVSDMAGAAGSELNGGGSSSDNCRRYATSYTVTSSGSFITVSCRFDRATLTMECSSDNGDVTATTWNTIRDAVAEYDPIGRRRATRTEETTTIGSGDCRLSRDFRYDAVGRLAAVQVTLDPDSRCGTNQATYDAWDSSGRPTHGVENGVGSETCTGGDITLIYDDAGRTITTARSGGTDCLAFTTILNHDADGLRTTAVNGKSGAISSAYETLTTDEICE